jgi:molybdopterin molybdotransferase
MITVEEAQKIIIDTTSRAKTQKVPISQSNQRVLAEDIYASRNQPPFDRVTMDGIAINSESMTTEYIIQGVQAAGQPQLELINKSMCIEVMTGAVLPQNTDCVIPYENIKIERDTKTAKVDIEDIISMNNIHKQSSDYKEGDLLVKTGTVITSPVCAVIASQGNSSVTVYKLPTIAIISTGSELIDLDQQVLPYQIFMSNSYAIESELKRFGINNIKKIHIPDNKKETESQIQEALNEFDIIILTGGVSKGKFDYIPDTLTELGVKRNFHKVSQKPGKPMWYGTKENKQVFALPGNPASCLVCLRRYVIPALEKQTNKKSAPTFCRLKKQITFKKNFTLFAAVKAEFNTNGNLEAEPVINNGSGDFYAVGQSTGFIELPPDQEIFSKDEIFPYYSWL